MKTLAKRFIRAGAFVGKEINEVRRQPRLILSLILGPFAILFSSALATRASLTSLTGIFVVPATGGFSQNAADYQKLVGDQLHIARHHGPGTRRLSDASPAAG